MILMRLATSAIVPSLLLSFAAAQDDVLEQHFVDVGAPGDEDVIGAGISHREGPVDDMGPVFDSTFRWCEDSFTLNLPVFPERPNLVSLRMRPSGGHELLVEAADRPIAIVKPYGDHRLEFILPADIIGDDEIIPVTFTAPIVLGPASEGDTRILFGPLDWVRVRPVGAPGAGMNASPVTINIGEPGDEPFTLDGFYGREGPYDKFGDFFRDTFRWAKPGFTLGVPVVPNAPNTIVLWADIAGDAEVIVEDSRGQLGVLSEVGTNIHQLTIPPERVGAREWLALTFRPQAGFDTEHPHDSRQLFCALSRVVALGEGDREPPPPRLPATHSLATAGYLARSLGASEAGPQILICPRVAVAADAGAKLPIHLQQEAAVLLANGCEPAIQGSDAVSAAALQVIREFARPRRAAVAGTRSSAYVAVVEPSAFRALASSSQRQATRPPAATLAAVDLLNRLHYPCDVIADDVGADSLRQYSLVIVPSVAWYADDLWPKLREYVKDGGALLAAGSASVTRDEGGAISHAMADTLGIEPVGKTSGNLLPSGGYVTAIGLAQLVDLTSAEQLLPLRSTDLPEKETLTAPGLTLNRTGEGRAVYIAGPIFTQASARFDPLVLPVLQQALRAALPEPLVKLDGAENVEVSLREKGSTLYIHLVNRTQARDAAGGPAYVEEALPVGPLTLKVRMPTAPKSVSLLPEGERPQTRWRDGVLSVTVPRFEVHVAVVADRSD